MICAICPASPRPGTRKTRVTGVSGVRLYKLTMPIPACKGWFLLAALCLLLAACTSPRGWVPLEGSALPAWQDDGELASLQAAVRQSIEYYTALPAETPFRFDSLEYSASEMAASMLLFLDTLAESPDAETLRQNLADRFLVFESLRVNGDNLFTGYYEPELQALTKPEGALREPLLAEPRDLIKVPLQRFGDSLPPRVLVGRVRGGELHPYPTRQEITGGRGLGDRARIIAYVHPVDLYFLQVQGSGVLVFPDGSRRKVGYASSNGRPYRSLGRLMIRRGLISQEEMSLQAIRAYLEANPGEMRRLLNANPSYVFFSEEEAGPLGNIRVPLTPGRSLAADHFLLPKGALAYVQTEVPGGVGDGGLHPFQRFMVIQDTGGAIRGHGRGDIFFGAGAEAEWKAGHLKSSGRLLVMVARKEALRQAGTRSQAERTDP